MEKRFEWHCREPDCCVFVGGTEQFDIYMAHCNTQPYDPSVVFCGSGEKCEWDNQADMDAAIDKVVAEGPCECLTTGACTCPVWRMGKSDLDALVAAQHFVHNFFPSPVAVAMNKIRNGEEL